MEIKQLTQKDSAATHEIMKKSFSTSWTRETIDALIKSGNAVCLGAFEGDVLMGYAFLEWVLDEGSLTDIAVQEDFRRKGISQKLMDSLLKSAVEKNLVFVTLEVRASNIPAISLYEKNGFMQIGKRKAYYTAPVEDALLMTKEFK